MRILQINQTDLLGGAAAIAWNLHQAYTARGHSARMAVSGKSGDDPHVYRFSEYASFASRRLKAAAHSFANLNSRYRGFGRIGALLHTVADPMGAWESLRGYESFTHPETWRLLRRMVDDIDIVHCHSLHGNYFDLRSLAWLSNKVPVVLSLHDAWLLAGHCVHSLDCPQLSAGCVPCPHIGRSRAIRRDGAGVNLQRKRRIYESGAFYVTTACAWLMEKAKSSILAPAIADSRVIPNGVDLSVFRPVARLKARDALGLPRQAKLLMTVGNDLQTNYCKDYDTLSAAWDLITRHFTNKDVFLFATGHRRDHHDPGSAGMRFLPYLDDARTLALYYAAADVLLHAAKVDTFPSAVLEAQACGTPVIASAVGGIPEQVKGSAALGAWIDAGLNQYASDRATGVLVPPGDPHTMADIAIRLVDDPKLGLQFGDNAYRHVCEHFSLHRSAEALLDWYQEILSRRGSPS